MFLASLVLNFTKQRKLTKKKKLQYTKFIIMKYGTIYYILIFTPILQLQKKINLRINFQSRSFF